MQHESDVVGIDTKTQGDHSPIQAEHEETLGASHDSKSATPLKPNDSDESQDHLNRLVNAAPVMLFMKGTPSQPQCGFSRQIVSLLREHGVKYGFFNILSDEKIRQELKVYADWPTYPQLWKDGELIGGLDIVKETLKTDPHFLSMTN